MTLYENVIAAGENAVVYDEYSVVVPWHDNLTMDVALNIDKWLASARSMEPSASSDPTDGEELADMKNALEILGVDADE